MTRSLPVIGLLGVLAQLSTNCATRAVAIPECREIEAARCRASAACGVLEQADVEACIRFYRDQCLHGIAGPEAPTAKAQQGCVSLIEVAGECAQGDPDMALSQCQAEAAGGAGGATEGGMSVCDFVGAPWDDATCDFLLPPPDAGGAPSE